MVHRKDRMADPGYKRLLYVLLKCTGCRPKVGFLLGGGISQERGEGGAEPVGEERDGTCGFRRTQLEGGATVLWGLLRRRLARRRLELGEMAAGGAGARGADRGMSRVRHFERKMKKGLESLGNDVP